MAISNEVRAKPWPLLAPSTRQPIIDVCMNVRWVCRALRAQACRLGRRSLHSAATRPGAVAVAGLAQEEGLQAWRRRQKVVVVTGPTAVGKTNVSLALAERLNGEIISADSVQVYRGLDVGSDKVSCSYFVFTGHHLHQRTAHPCCCPLLSSILPWTATRDCHREL